LVEVRGALPRTATGKLQKCKLREPYWEGRERRVNQRSAPPAPTFHGVR
jgi:acyl-CoA synthetase (AMP-forming)/AMP-acid ligase II